MRTRQRGVGLMGLIIGLIILVVVALFGMKLLPSFMEYRAAKGAIQAIVRERPGASVQDIRKAFEARSTIDGIESIKSTDLEISKQGNETVIGFGYRKEVPLFANVGVYINYAASTGSQ